MTRHALLCGLILVAGCTSPAAEQVRLEVGLTDGRCTVAVNGRSMPFDPDTADLRRWRGRHITLVGAPDIPYRCVGGLIFALQRAGVRRIGFLSEPAPARRNGNPN